MNEYFAEFVGTTILLLLGNGIVANVLLTGTKGNDSGWIAITGGWGLSVFVAVLCVEQYSGAHINPAVTIGLAAAGRFEWNHVPGFVICQMGGAMLGATLAYVFYKPHYARTKDPDVVLATFCTAPNIRSSANNFYCELVATFVLVYGVLLMSEPSFTLENASTSQEVKVGLGAIGALPVGLIVFAIGLSLGGTTGYAINPARDLGPRIVHAILPIDGKRDSDWSYAWIPIMGPIAGGVAAALLFVSTTT